MTGPERKVLESAIYHYGKRNQIIVAVEELSELQKELRKILRGMGSEDHLAFGLYSSTN